MSKDTKRAADVGATEAKAGTAVAVAREMLPTTTIFEASADAGFEHTTSDDYAIPFLKIVQKTSPEVDPDDGAYLAGAKAGQFIDTASLELFDEVEVLPCHYKRAMVVWKPDRGGYVRQEPVGYEVNLPRKKRDDGSESGVLVDADGNDVVDTRYFFCLRKLPDGSTSPVVLSFTSTQLKKARNWLTRMQALKATAADGHRFTLPMFANIWRLTTVPEQNDRGSWRGFKLDLVGQVTDPALAQAAKTARDLFLSTADKVKPPSEPAKKPEDDIPY